MDPAKWEQVKRVFASALDREPQERIAFLKEACAGDETLRAEVESLLSQHQSTDCPEVSSEDSAAHGTFEGRRLGPYQLIRRHGHGGMATVYLAARADDEYHKCVAVKVVNQPLGSDEMLRRFRNERQTLAALDHPNIVKLLDGGTTQEGLPYLVMDYVEGIPIDEYCDAHRLSIRERLQLFRKVCQAVHYAHQNLVIHRDLKPGNILVSADGSPKLLDFGIAKLLNPAFASQTVITQTDMRPMTPEYASPEQVRGEAVTAASDVYSLGIVLYELLTGHHPYRLKRHTATEIEKVICEEEPERPSTAVTHAEVSPDSTTVTCSPEEVCRTRNERRPESLSHHLHGDLDNIVMMALRKEPRRRYASVEQFSEDIRRYLEGLPVIARQPTVTYRFEKFVRRHVREEVASALVVAALVAGFALSNWHTYRAAVLRRNARHSIAVLGFKNLSQRQETAWLSTALSEMLTTELGAGEKLRTIPGENVAHMKVDLALADTDSLSEDTLTRVRKNLGTDFVVLGSYLDLGKDAGGQIRLDLRLQDATAGETIASVSETGSEAEVLNLVAQAGGELRQHLGIGEVTPAQAQVVKAALPANTEAARYYAEGLEKLRRFDALSARDLLGKAVADDPNHAMAHSALAEAWMRLGYDEHAKEQAKTAFHLSSELSSEERLLVEGRYRQANKEWDRAIEIYRTLFKSYPDNVDYGLLLAEVELSGGKAGDALRTTELLRSVPAPARDDARIDALESRAARRLGQHERALAAAARTIEKTRSQGTRLLLAPALATRCQILYEQGQPVPAKTACDEAEQVFTATGDRNGLAGLLDLRAYFLNNQGDYDRALELEDRAHALFREVGNKHGLGWSINDTATVYWSRGDLTKAMDLYQQAEKVFREIGDKNSTATTMENYASVLSGAGDPIGAKQITERALAIYREVDDHNNITVSYVNIGRYLFLTGELRESWNSLEQSLKMLSETGGKTDTAFALTIEGSILFEQDDLPGARRKQEEALAIRKQIAEKGSVADNVVSLAEVSIEEGRAAQAEASVRAALEVFRQERSVPEQVYTVAIMARDLLAQGKAAEAQQMIDEARTLSANCQDVPARLTYAIEAARVRAALGQTAAAIAHLRSTVGEAKRHGYLGNELKAQLVLGELEMKSGQRAAGRAHLEALEKEARAKGFGLVARKAATARG